MRRFVTILTVLLLLTGCAKQAESHTKDFFAMNTVMSVTVSGENSEEDSLRAMQIVQELDKQWSVTNENSAVYQLNETGTAELSDETAELLRRSLQLKEETGGAFDPTIYHIVKMWGFTTGEYRVPTDAELADALEMHRNSSITLDGNRAAISGCAVDLGAVAKGYTAAKIASELEHADTLNLNLGGNIQLEGTKPDGSPWRVGIKNPENTEEYLGILELESGAVVTSGGYERYFEQDGVRYCHIIDPKTGRPADKGLISVTIVSEDGFLGDALSTALYVMGLEEASAFWRGRTDFEAVLVTDAGEIYATEGLQDSFSGCEFQVITR